MSSTQSLNREFYDENMDDQGDVGLITTKYLIPDTPI